MARKPGLGKGLGALIPNGAVETEQVVVASTEGPLRRVPVGAIRPNPFQPRKCSSQLLSVRLKVSRMSTN